jgi:hypothetical protein
MRAAERAVRAGGCSSCVADREPPTTPPCCRLPPQPPHALTLPPAVSQPAARVSVYLQLPAWSERSSWVASLQWCVSQSVVPSQAPSHLVQQHPAARLPSAAHSVPASPAVPAPAHERAASGGPLPTHHVIVAAPQPRLLHHLHGSLHQRSYPRRCSLVCGASAPSAAPQPAPVPPACGRFVTVVKEPTCTAPVPVTTVRSRKQ